MAKTTHRGSYICACGWKLELTRSDAESVLEFGNKYEVAVREHGKACSIRSHFSRMTRVKWEVLA